MPHYNKNYLTQIIKQLLLLSAVGSSMHAYAEDDPKQLPTVEVQSQNDVASYSSASSNAATKLDLRLKDTPQSISVISSQQIADQDLHTVEEVLEKVPGVYVNRSGAQGAIGNGGEYVFYYARGKQIVNYQVDGVMTSPATSGKNGSSLSNVNPVIYENITVIKGAAGLTNGAGFPSASVGLNRKHAHSVIPTGVVKVSAGSDDALRSEFDVQGALSKDGDVRGRVVAAYGQSDSWRKWGDEYNATLYGVIDADLTAHTTLSVGGMLSRSRVDGLGVHGIDMYGEDDTIMPFARDFNASAKWAYSQVDSLNLFAEVQHEFANRWKLQVNYNYSKQDIESLYGVIGTSQVNYTDMTASFVAARNDFSPEEHSLDTSLSGPYRLFGREHQLMLGASYQQLKSNNPAYSSYSGKAVVDLNTWTGDIVLPAAATKVVGVSNKDYEQSGFYLATRLNPIDRLHLILGGRLSNYDLRTYSTNTDKNTTTSSKIKVSDKLTPYTGITFDLLPNLSAYASYTNIFLPQNYRDEDYNLLDPQEGNNYEGGFKASFYDGRLNLSAAYFLAEMDNVAVSAGTYQGGEGNGLATAGSTYYRGVKNAETKGFELEVAGEILHNWNISAGYTHAKSTDAAGERINTDIPEQQFKLFSSYKLPILDSRLTVGGGVTWQSEFYDSSVTGVEYEAYRQKSFALVDLMARYALSKDLSLGLNISNLTDKKYRLSTWTNTYGDPRSYSASLAYKF